MVQKRHPHHSQPQVTINCSRGHPQLPGQALSVEVLCHISIALGWSSLLPSCFSQVYKATRSTFKDTLRPQRLPAEPRRSSKPPSPGNHQLLPNSPPAIFLTANSHEQEKDIKMHHYYMHYNIICVTLSWSPSIICAGHTWV